MAPTPCFVSSPMGLDWPSLRTSALTKKGSESETVKHEMKSALLYIWDDVVGDTSEGKALKMFERKEKDDTLITTSKFFPIDRHTIYCSDLKEALECNCHCTVGKITIFGLVFYRGLYSSGFYKC